MMSGQTQKSIIGYAPQPYFKEGTITYSYSGIQSVINVGGLLDPDLSNYTTIICTPGETLYSRIKISFNKRDSYLTGVGAMVGVIGCSVITYADDGAGNPDMGTAYPEDITSVLNSNNFSTILGGNYFGYARRSFNDINTWAKTPMPGIIAGGTTNIIHSGLGKFKGGDGAADISIRLTRLTADVAARPHAHFKIGHVFIGVELPVLINPQSFSWSAGIENNRFKSRDEGTLSSEGTMIRKARAEITKISHDNIVGSSVKSVSLGVPSELVYSPNFFDLVKSNNSYPVVFNPFPIVAATSGPIEYFNLTARQNFCSIYGFLDDTVEIQPDEFRDGLNSEYKARFSITETR